MRPDGDLRSRDTEKLQVRCPERMRRAATGKAKDVRETVEKELGRDRLLHAAGITVINVNGKVALNGTVPSYPQYLQAAETARQVAVVTGVRNHLQVGAAARGLP